MKLEFMDAQEMSKENPNSFQAPTPQELKNIKPTDYIKVGIAGERFWCEVKANEGEKITAIISNDLVKTEFHFLKYLDEIQLKTSNILIVEKNPSFISEGEELKNIRPILKNCNKIIYYTCSFCGILKSETAFKTDVFAGTNKEEMTCEDCYDEINNEN